MVKWQHLFITLVINMMMVIFKNTKAHISAKSSELLCHRLLTENLTNLDDVYVYLWCIILSLIFKYMGYMYKLHSHPPDSQLEMS